MIPEILPNLDAIQELARNLQRVMLPFREISALQRHLQRQWDALLSIAEKVKVEWDRAMPDNWKMLDAAEIHDLVDIMARTGLGLAWVPREEILREMLQAPDDIALMAVLDAREAEILEDLDRSLDEVTTPPIRDLKEVAREAIASFRAGHARSAQALVAATLTSVAEDNLASSLGQVRRNYSAIDPMQETGSLRDLRIIALLVGMATSVLAQFRPPADPIPDTFNRHASLHTVAPRQYTRRNALAALVALLRELHERAAGPQSGGGG